MNIQAIATVRAPYDLHAGPDSSEAKKVIEDLNKAFEEFKATNDEEIAQLKKGAADVVTTEKLDRVNASVSELQKEIDEFNKKIARLSVGSGDKDETSPEAKEHAKAFNQYFRRGTEAGLRELEINAAISTDSNPDGGYLIPEELESTIDRVLGTVSAIRNLCRVINISSDTYKKLVNVGGAGSGWVGQRESRTETSTPTLEELVFTAMELYAEPASTQQALDDSRLDIAGWLADEVSTKFAEDEGAAFATGTGVQEPKGILSYTKVANASYVWGKTGFITSGAAAAFATTDPVDKFIDLIHALKSGYRQNATWLTNDLTVSTVRKFKDGQGQLLWQPSIQLGVPPLLLGYPVVTDDNMPDVAADAFSIAFADFRRAYMILDRQGIRVLRDPLTNKPFVKFYTTKRVGGGIQNFEAIKLMKIAA